MRLVFVTLFLPFILIGQQDQVLQITYNVFKDGLNFEEVLQSNGAMIVSTTESIEIKSSKTRTETGLSIKRGTKIPKYTHYKQVSSNDLFLKIHNDQVVVLKDILPKIEWTLSETETKMIGDYQCRLATASFRGSDIYAYFTTEIPIALGPWKFYGLPGAILECGTADRMDQWLATNIVTKAPVSDHTEWDFDFSKDYKSFKSARIEYDQALKERIKRRHTKLPKGINRTTEIKRQGIEKIYEWEIETE